MAILIRTTRVALNTSTGTQNVTISGIGTPKAVKVIISKATADDTAVVGACGSIGVSDGTNSYSFSFATDDNVDTSSTGTKYGANLFDLRTDSSGTVGVTASFSSWVTDGVQINITATDGTAYLATFIFYCGSDLSVYVGTSTPTTVDVGVDVTSVGFEADIVEFFAPYSLTNWTVQMRIGMGLAHNDRAGGVVGYCRYFGSGNGYASGVDYSGIFDTDDTIAVYSNAAGSSMTSRTEVSSFDSSGFTLTPRVGAHPANVPIIFLALRFGSGPVVGSWVGLHVTPTSTGNYDDTGPGFTPQYLCLLPTLVESGNLNLFMGDTTAFSVGHVSADSNAQYCQTWTAEDNAPTMNDQCLTDDQLVDVPLNTGAAGIAGTWSQWNSNGWRTNYSDIETTGRYFLAWAVEEEVTAVFPFSDDFTGTDRSAWDSAKWTTSVEA